MSYATASSARARAQQWPHLDSDRSRPCANRPLKFRSAFPPRLYLQVLAAGDRETESGFHCFLCSQHLLCRTRPCTLPCTVWCTSCGTCYHFDAGCCSSALFRYDPNELSMEDDSEGATSAIKNLNFSKVSSGGGGYRRSSHETRVSSGARNFVCLSDRFPLNVCSHRVILCIALCWY